MLNGTCYIDQVFFGNKAIKRKFFRTLLVIYVSISNSPGRFVSSNPYSAAFHFRCGGGDI